MWQEINPAKNMANDLMLGGAAGIAAGLMLMDLYVHPQGGISYEPHRKALPELFAQHAGNATPIGIMVATGIILSKMIEKIDHPTAKLLSSKIMKTTLAIALFAVVDIELATPNNAGEMAGDLTTGIATGGAMAFALQRALSNLSGIPPQVGDSADEIFP